MTQPFSIQPPYGIDPLTAPYVINLLLTPSSFKLMLCLAAVACWLYARKKALLKWPNNPQRANLAATISIIMLSSLLSAIRTDTVFISYAMKTHAIHRSHPTSADAFASLREDNAFLIRIKPLIRSSYRISTHDMDTGTARKYSQKARLILAPLAEDQSARQTVVFNATKAYNRKTAVLGQGNAAMAGLKPELVYDSDRILLGTTNAP